MNKTIIAIAASLGMAAGAFGQGAINLENNSSGGALSFGSEGNYFYGNYTLQLWYLNTSTLPGNVNSDGNAVSAATSYANLQASWTLAATFTAQNITSDNAGTFVLGQVNIPGITPAGATTSFAIAAWTAGANGNTQTPGASFSGNGGVFAFVNPTANYTALPTPTAPDPTGWNSSDDLILTPLTPTPEPSSLALAGLGGFGMLMAMRRKKA